MEKWNDYDSGFAEEERMMDRVWRESRIPRAFFFRVPFGGRGRRKGLGPVFRAHGGMRWMRGKKRGKRNGMINRGKNKWRMVGEADGWEWQVGNKSKGKWNKGKERGKTCARKFYVYSLRFVWKTCRGIVKIENFYRKMDLLISWLPFGAIEYILKRISI